MTKLTGPNGTGSVALSDLVCFDLYTAARAITRAYRPVLSGLGLTYPQYLVMVMLWQHAPRTVKDLGENLDLDSGTLSPLFETARGIRPRDPPAPCRRRAHGRDHPDRKRPVPRARCEARSD